jgi:uncharacterized membrane protein
MKTIYYFLEWHWKRYKFNYIDLIPIFGLSILLAFILGAIGYKVLAGFIVFVVLVAFVLALIKGLIIDPIIRSFREYKEEQRELLNKINYGDRDHDRFTKRR